MERTTRNTIQRENEKNARTHIQILLNPIRSTAKHDSRETARAMKKVIIIIKLKVGQKAAAANSWAS